MDSIRSGGRGAQKVADAAISARVVVRLPKRLPLAMTSWEQSRQNGTTINALEGSMAPACCVEKPREPR